MRCLFCTYLVEIMDCVCTYLLNRNEYTKAART